MSTTPEKAEVVATKPLKKKSTRGKSRAKSTKTRAVAKRTTRAPVKRTPAAPPTVEEIMMKIVEKGGDVAALEKMVDLKERLDAKAAEKAFNRAFAKFQLDCPIIPKTKEGARTKPEKGGHLVYKYAPKEVIVEHLKAPLASNGFSYTYSSTLSEDGKRRSTTCYLTHEDGHTKEATFESGIDTGTSVMNAIQKEGSTVKYGERYSLMMVTGVATEDDVSDDDGAGAGNPPVESELTEKQIEELEKALSVDPKLKPKFLSAYKLMDIRMLPKAQYDDVMKKISAWADTKDNPPGNKVR